MLSPFTPYWSTAGQPYLRTHVHRADAFYRSSFEVLFQDYLSYYFCDGQECADASPIVIVEAGALLWNWKSHPFLPLLGKGLGFSWYVRMQIADLQKLHVQQRIILQGDRQAQRVYSDYSTDSWDGGAVRIHMLGCLAVSFTKDRTSRDALRLKTKV